MKSTWRLFINIGFFSWNQPEAWNQPERDEINRNKKQVIINIGRHCIGRKGYVWTVPCDCWFLKKFWNHPRFARGDFKTKPRVDFFPNHPQKHVITSTNSVLMVQRIIYFFDHVYTRVNLTRSTKLKSNLFFLNEFWKF